MQNWYILLTIPHGEIGAAGGLIGRGYTAFAPQIKRRVKQGRGKVVDRAWAMFPGYMFVRCAQKDFLNVRGVPKIRDFLKVQGDPVTIREEAVFAIRDKELELEQKRLAKLKAKITHDFRAGQDIEISEGPFAKMLTKIEGVDAQGRITVLLNMLGRAASVTLDAGQVKAA